MTGRHASATDVDDEALAAQPQQPGSHRADIVPDAEKVPVPATRKPPGRRAAKPKETT